MISWKIMRERNMFHGVSLFELKPFLAGVTGNDICFVKYDKTIFKHELHSGRTSHDLRSIQYQIQRKPKSASTAWFAWSLFVNLDYPFRFDKCLKYCMWQNIGINCLVKRGQKLAAHFGNF